MCALVKSDCIWRSDYSQFLFGQPFHGAREIFRLDFSDEYEIERLIRPVKIHSRANFAVLEKFADDDVFLAESEYSFTTKVIMRTICNMSSAKNASQLSCFSDAKSSRIMI